MRPGCSKPYPVAMIPYVNMLPYRVLGPPSRCGWHDYVPRESVGALAAGRVIAAAVPVGALAGLGDCVEPLGRFGIAARKSSMSVLFFSNHPLNEFRETDRLRITPDSATSVRLLYLLLSYQQSAPGLRRLDSESGATGELVIGDQALQRMYAGRSGVYPIGGLDGVRPYRHVADLATRWYQHHRLPFVFARWVIRRDAPPEARAALLDWLNAFKEREDALVDRSIPIAAQQLGLPESLVAIYYRCLGRVLDEADIEGQALFLREIRRNRLDAVERRPTRSVTSPTGSTPAYPGNSKVSSIDGFRLDWDVSPNHRRAGPHHEEAL